MTGGRTLSDTVESDLSEVFSIYRDCVSNRNLIQRRNISPIHRCPTSLVSHRSSTSRFRTIKSRPWSRYASCQASS